jgi:acrylyl-CoA reductase (NADPH)
MASRSDERRRFVLSQQQSGLSSAPADIPDSCRAFVVDRIGETVHGEVQEVALSRLPAGDVLIRVSHSSLNYKDAMAATGHRGIVKSFPHIPGIDAAGIVAESSDPRFRPGDEVIATGRAIGVEQWGGWSEYVRVPAHWVQPMPAGLTRREAMILGTAGFTAAQCIAAIVERDIIPEQGDVLVTGATGGVGSIAVQILSQLGYSVVAVTGKDSQRGWLMELGASDVLLRSEFIDSSTKPLLTDRWAAGVDTVGGQTLSTLIRSTEHRGCVAACGVVGGGDLPLTVYPFILRGVTLAGIDSAWCPDDRRAEIWKRLGSDWKPRGLDKLGQDVPLADVWATVQLMLAGQTMGRWVVVP